ncbi:ribonuclease HII [bacterium]|nr:ribonuclease HII [bacterium]
MLSHFLAQGTEVGCDEAGRGCLAGPVVAAAAIIPRGESFEFLNDSKKLNEKQRAEAAAIIKTQLKHWAIGVVSPQRIDEINILKASFEAMHRALDQLSCTFDMILVDGNRFVPYHQVPHQCVVKGDGKYQSIAAASILAKTHRDELMKNYHLSHPQYGWNQNMGYPTAKHRKAIAQFGDTELHRKSFNLLGDGQLKLF